MQRNVNGHPGGFKEVFGTPSRRSSCDSLDKFNKTNSEPKRRNSSDDFTDFSKDSSTIDRKISKVGNKKSDKFLGENLSDCLSNSPFLASTPILAKKVDDSTKAGSNDALENFVNSNVSQIERSVNNIVAEKIERPKVIEVNQSQPGPIQMHIQYSKEPEQRQSLPKAAVDDYKETVENLDKRAEFLMTMVNHEFNSTDAVPQPEETMTAPKRRRSKNISTEDVSPNANSEISRDAKPEVNEQIQIIRKEQMESNNDLKLDLSQKKKEFPKSNPDSPNIYAHLQPVEHELIVPVRKNYKHICDDDEHVHKPTRKHGHSHDHSSIVNLPDGIIEHVRVEENKSQENISPKKPERDFSRYRKSEDLSILEEPRDESVDIIESQIIRPERKKGRSISRDSLPTPPPRPIKLAIDRKISLQEPLQPKKNRKISLQEPMRGLFESQKLPDTPVTPMNTPMLNDNEYEKIETFLKVIRFIATANELKTFFFTFSLCIFQKCSSSQSFLTKELMDQLVDKVYGYSSTWDDQMEQGMLHTKCDDGSEKVGPSSKLTTRKVSVIRKDTPPIRIQENIDEVKKATFLIGTSDLQPLLQANADELQAPVTPNSSSLIKRTDTVLELLPDGAPVQKIVVAKNESSPSESTNPDPDLDVVKVLLKSTEIHEGSETNALEDIYKKNRDIMDDFKNYLEDKKINAEMMTVANNTEVDVIIEEEIDKSHSLFPDHVSINSFDSANESDNDSDSLSIKNKRLAIAQEPRRGSIVEHDQWFLKHRDISSQGRRGSDCPTTYDTTKLFPFGKREKTYSESNDFFGNDDLKKSKSSDHVNLDGADQLDHSTLLKYFHTSNKAESNKAEK